MSKTTSLPEQTDRTEAKELQSKLKEFYGTFHNLYPLGFQGRIKKLAGVIASRIGFDPHDICEQMKKDGVLVEEPVNAERRDIGKWRVCCHQPI